MVAYCKQIHLLTSVIVSNNYDLEYKQLFNQ